MKPIQNANFGKTAEDYLTHRPGFPDSLFKRLSEWGYGLPGQTLLDLGTGTGTLGRGFAQQGVRVTGIDPSAEMLSAAKIIDQHSNLDTHYIQASAEATTLPDQSFDVVTAGQCWHWFDRSKAAIEVRRLLKPDGSLLVCYFDWLPLAGNLVRKTELLIEAHNPEWRGGNQFGIHPQVFRDLGDAGYSRLESFTYDEPVTFTPESWRGRIRASAGVGASLGEAAVAAFDQALANMLASEYPGATLIVPHRIFALRAFP